MILCWAFAYQQQLTIEFQSLRILSRIFYVPFSFNPRGEGRLSEWNVLRAFVQLKYFVSLRFSQTLKVFFPGLTDSFSHDFPQFFSCVFARQGKLISSGQSTIRSLYLFPIELVICGRWKRNCGGRLFGSFLFYFYWCLDSTITLTKCTYMAQSIKTHARFLPFFLFSLNRWKHSFWFWPVLTANYEAQHIRPPNWEWSRYNNSQAWSGMHTAIWTWSHKAKGEKAKWYACSRETVVRLCVRARSEHTRVWMDRCMP